MSERQLKAKAASKYIVPTGSRVAAGDDSPVAPSDSTQHAPQLAKGYSPGKLDIYFLGITLVISGQYFSWNLGLAAGLYSYLIVYLLMGLAYVAFCCCMAEVTSALPFAGGAFGLARCTLGFFPAYLIGCCETIEYIVSVSIIVLALADLFVLMLPSLASVRPLIWLAFYLSSVGLQIRGHGAFWITSLVVGALSLLILLDHVDLKANALSDSTQLFVGGLHGAMAVLPNAAWFFLGVEALNLASDDVPSPKTQIPVAQVACVCTLFATGLSTFLTTVSLPATGGLLGLSRVLAPLNSDFMAFLHVDATVATLLSIPSQYAAAYGLGWAHSKLIHGMAQSKLLPPVLASTTSALGTPYAASIVDAVLGFVICLAVSLEPRLGVSVLPLCLLFAFASYAGQCLGYLSLRAHYPLVRQRRFRNPFGVAGALYSLSVWLVSIVALVGFHGSPATTVALFGGTLAVLALYYVAVAKTRQVMSEDESKVLLKAHILKFNERKRKIGRVARLTRAISSTAASSVRRI